MAIWLSQWCIGKNWNNGTCRLPRSVASLLSSAQPQPQPLRLLLFRTTSSSRIERNLNHIHRQHTHTHNTWARQKRLLRVHSMCIGPYIGVLLKCIKSICRTPISLSSRQTHFWYMKTWRKHTKTTSEVATATGLCQWFYQYIYMRIGFMCVCVISVRASLRLHKQSDQHWIELCMANLYVAYLYLYVVDKVKNANGEF